MYIVSRGKDSAKLPIMHGAAPNNNYLAQDVNSSGVERNPVLECQVGNKKIQASVTGSCFLSAPIFLFCKMELKISTLAMSQSFWGKSGK